MMIEMSGSDIVVDADLIGTLLRLPAADVPRLLRDGTITSICESGIEADQGQYRLSFFYRSRRARIRLTASGEILQRSSTQIAPRPGHIA